MTTRFERPHDHPDRMRQARRRAQWELGDPHWAEVIIDAYLDPKGDAAALAAEDAEWTRSALVEEEV